MSIKQEIERFSKGEMKEYEYKEFIELLIFYNSYYSKVMKDDKRI
jgi:hypothetical protein